MIDRQVGSPRASQGRPSPARNARRPPQGPGPLRSTDARSRAAITTWTSRLAALRTTRWLPLLLVVAGLGIFAVATLWGSTDEELIRARLTALADAIEVKASETNAVIRAARIKDAFSDILIKEVTVEIPELTEVRSGRMELVRVAAQAMTLWRTAQVDVSGLRLDIDKAGLSAVASGSVPLRATRHSGEAELDTRTVSIRFDKIDGRWLIVSVAVSAKHQADGDG